VTELENESGLENKLHIRAGLDIPLAELHFRFSRSSGPGGQHVNKSATRVELLFDIARSPSLSEEQRARLMLKLAHHLDSEGVLHLVSQSSRSQLRNREELLGRLQALIASALVVPRVRHPTRPTFGSREKRLTAKRQRSEIKRLRRPTGEE
jgi:ribosome-associated protein